MKSILYILIPIITFSCNKEEEEKYSDTPEIAFIGMTPTSTTEFQDQVRITITYQDGNGDLGTADPDYYSLFIKDARLSAYDNYHIQPLSPPDQSLQIEGELDVVLTGLFVLDTINSESTSFSIKIRDRAGNWSNEVQTGLLIINKAQ
jgi:hypothetical protein